MIKSEKNQLAKAWILAAASVTMTFFLILSAIFLFFFADRNYAAAHIDDSMSAVIISYDNDSVVLSEQKWLARSLESAGLPVFSIDMEADSGKLDITEMIAKWHNWKLKRGIEQGFVWIISAGLEADTAIETSLSWENSGLVILLSDDELRYFSDWQEFTASVAMRWPLEKAMMIYHEAVDRNNAAVLFERTSNEDAWLFPGYRQNPYSAVSTVQSSDNYTLLAEIQPGSLSSNSWSESFNSSITSEVISRSIMVSTVSGQDTAYRIQQASNNLKIHWYILPFAAVLMSLAALLAGLAQNVLTASELKNEQSELINEEQKQQFLINSGKVQLLLRLSVFISFIVLTVIISSGVGLLPLITASWWITALVMIALMMLLIPDARLGLSDRHISKAPGVRIAAGLIWIAMIFAFVMVFLKAVIFNPVPIDSLVWFATAILLTVSARITTRHLSAAGCRIWLTLPAGAWLILNGLAILSHFAGFN